MMASLKQPATVLMRSSRPGDARCFSVVRFLAWLQAMMCALCMVLLVLDASVPQQQHNAIAHTSFGRRAGPTSRAYTAALSAARVCVLLLDMSGLFLAVALLRLLPIGASTQGQSINAPGRGEGWVSWYGGGH